MTKVMGLDLSLTRTGYALPSGEVGVLVPPKNADRGMPRLEWIRDQVYRHACNANVVVIEGYSFSSRDSHAHALGELGGVVRLRLHERGILFIDVPPAALKKYATGKGNANKELMLVEAVKRLGYAGSDNNEADALWLREMGMAKYDTHGVAAAVPALNREALDKLPTLFFP